MKIIKNKWSVIWLVFCFVALIALQNYQAVTPTSNYDKGFLERLDAEGHAIEKHVGKSDDYLFNPHLMIWPRQKVRCARC